jgi:hypothetical protein
MMKKIKSFFYKRKVTKLASALLPILLLDEVYEEKEDAVFDSIFFAEKLLNEIDNELS